MAAFSPQENALEPRQGTGPNTHTPARRKERMWLGTQLLSQASAKCRHLIVWKGKGITAKAD